MKCTATICLLTRKLVTCISTLEKKWNLWESPIIPIFLGWIKKEISSKRSIILDISELIILHTWIFALFLTRKEGKGVKMQMEMLVAKLLLCECVTTTQNKAPPKDEHFTLFRVMLLNVIPLMCFLIMTGVNTEMYVNMVIYMLS